MQANINLSRNSRELAEIELKEPEVIYVNPEDGYTLTKENADIFVDELLDYIQDQTRWRRISGRHHIDGSLDGRGLTREHMILDSRVVARREPLSKQAVRLYTTYLGIQNVNFKSEEEALADVWKEQCWNHPINKRVFGPLYRRKLSLRLLTDGELFFSLFRLDGGVVGVRLVDTLQIPEAGMVSDPDDRDTILLYRRVVPVRNVRTEFPQARGTALDGRTRRVLYYKDKDVTEEQILDSGFVLPDTSQFARNEDGSIVDMFHLPYDALGRRGNGLLFAVLNYIHAHNQFIQDRATIVKALTQYVREITVDGGSKAVNDVAARLRSSLTTGQFFERNPPDAAGSTWVQNQAMSKKETPPVTNAGDAMQDNRIIRQPIGSGVGITEANLTGDPSIGNLASQFAMNGPQLQNFEDYQAVWESGIMEIWQYVLEENGATAEEGDLTVILPPVLETDPASGVPQTIAARNNRLVTHKDAARKAMSMLGIENIDEALETLEGEENERQEQIKQQQQQQNNPNNPSVAREMDDLFKEHGVEVEGNCPLKHEGQLLEMHGLTYCQSCRMTFDPAYVRDTTDRP